MNEESPRDNLLQRLGKFSLQTRLVLLVMLISAFVLITALGLIYHSISTAYVEQAENEIARLNEQLSKTVTVWFNANVQSLNSLANTPDIQSMEGPYQEPLLISADQAYEDVYLIHTINHDGFNVARSDGQENRDYSDRKYVQSALGGVTIAFESLIGRTSGQPALILATPIYNRSSLVEGVIAFALDLDEISKGVQISKVGETGVSYIVDHENKLIAHPDPNLTSELVDYSNYPPVSYLRQGGSGLYEFADESGVVWKAQVKLIDNGWGVIVQQHSDELEAGLAEIQRTTILLAAAGLITLLMLSTLVVRYSLKPISMLTEAATAIASGDLGRKVPVKNQDEIGKLSTAFNLMTEKLNSTLATLEYQVAERTRELDASFKVSRRLVSIRNIHELTVAVVEEVRQTFNFYHVHIYLFDESKKNLIMVGGTGQIGDLLLSRNHQIPARQGLVGRAAETNQAVIVNDTSADLNWLPNPLLPDTKSEAAVPLAIGDNVLGVLDVQQNIINGIGAEQVEILKALANQTAIAVENARLITTAQDQLEQAVQARSISQKIQTATSIESVLQIALQGLTEATGANRASIQIGLGLFDSNGKPEN